MRISCHHCASKEYLKNGSSNGVQRYICKGCNRTFTSNVPRFSKQTKEYALHMYLNNVGVRKTALFVKASPSSILKWVRKAGKELSARLEQASEVVKDSLPDIIEMDEIFTFIQKNAKERSSGLLILGDKVVLLRLK